MSEERRGRLAAVGARLVAIARSAVAAGVELRAALQEDEVATVAVVAQSDAGQELQAKKEAHRSSKQEDEKSKSQEDLVPATTPVPQQWEEVFASEAPSTIQEDKNQEMDMLALETIVKNQEELRSLMAELMQSMGTVEQRIRNIEQEMGLITRFTQELNELGEDNWT